MTITLATLSDATAQEVFDQVVVNLLSLYAKNTKSFDDDCGYCMYRWDGLKCAAGCLIGDDEYEVEFEDKGWDTLIKENKVPESHCLLIENLQKIHDRLKPHEWIEPLRRIAANFDLNTTILDLELQKSHTT